MKTFVTLLPLILLSFPALSQNREDTLKEIEQKYGEQWDFCTCVVKNDSIHQALIAPNVTEEEFDLIIERSDRIERHCMAFLIQHKTDTPEERALHERKVKECLKNEK